MIVIGCVYLFKMDLVGILVKSPAQPPFVIQRVRDYKRFQDSRRVLYHAVAVGFLAFFAPLPELSFSGQIVYDRIVVFCHQCVEIGKRGSIHKAPKPPGEGIQLFTEKPGGCGIHNLQAVGAKQECTGRIDLIDNGI